MLCPQDMTIDNDAALTPPPTPTHIDPLLRTELLDALVGAPIDSRLAYVSNTKRDEFLIRLAIKCIEEGNQALALLEDTKAMLGVCLDDAKARGGRGSTADAISELLGDITNFNNNVVEAPQMIYDEFAPFSTSLNTQVPPSRDPDWSAA